MIDFKNPENAGPNGLTLAALLILIATLVYMLAFKPPSVEDVSVGHSLTKRNTYTQIENAKQKALEVRKTLAPKFWQGGSVEVTADILSKLTNEVNRYGLTLTSFRPDTDKDLAGFTELKYTVQVAGPYPKIRSLLTSLDGGSDKVALGSVQIAASPNTNDSVQATLSISAYLVTDQSLLPASGGAAHA